MKCSEHIFEPTPNELAGGVVTAEPCIMRLHHRIIRYRMRALSRDRGPILQKQLPL